MNRVKSPLFWVGLALTAVVVLLVFFGGKMLTPASVEVPVALADIPPGTEISPRLFRLERWSGVEGSTLSEYVTRNEFGPYIGAVSVETVHAGFPLGKAQVAKAGEDNPRIRRLTLTLEEGQVAFPLPVEADTAGNYIQAGDYVDLVFSVGSVNAREMDNPPPPTPTPPAIAGLNGPPGSTRGQDGETKPVTETVRLPVSKLVVQNVEVLRVEREMIRNASTSGSMGLGGNVQSQPTYTEGDIERLYVTLDQNQLEIISFILNNGDVRVAAHATVYPERPTEGVTWDDFEDWLFEQRESLEEDPSTGLAPASPSAAEGTGQAEAGAGGQTPPGMEDGR